MSTEIPASSNLSDVPAREVIDKSSPIPLHYQLERFLRQGIENGRFAPHTQLPTEQELQDYFDLSRTPIRQAIGKLAADGLVVRRRSQGTVVLSRPFEEDLQSLSSFTEEVERRGQTPRGRVVSFGVQRATPEDAHNLGIVEGDRVYRIRRVRYINREPVGLIISHVPVALAPNFKADDFGEVGPQQSIYHVLEHTHNVKLVSAVETFDAVSLDDESAALLELPVGSPILSRVRTSYTANGRAAAYEKGLYRVRYRLQWSGRRLAAADGGVVAE